jgi:hypothetical protein
VLEEKRLQEYIPVLHGSKKAVKQHLKDGQEKKEERRG